MKKQLWSMISLIMIMQLTGCGTSKEGVSTSTSKVEEVDVENEGTLKQEKFHLTKEQKIEDFQYLIDTMNSLYPYLGEIEENGKNLKEIEVLYLEKVKATTSSVEYLNTVLDYFDELDAYTIGHLTPLPAGFYEVFVEMYSDRMNRQSWNNVMINPVSKQMYSLFESDEEGRFIEQGAEVNSNQDTNQERQDEDAENKEASNEDASIEYAFSLEIIENNTVGYIRVPSFMTNHMEGEVPQIQSFIKENRDLENIIIDIRGNSGGNDGYWMEAFAKPNIEEAMYYSNYYLYNEATLEHPASKPFIQEIHPHLYEERTSISELKHFANLSPYANRFEYFTYGETEVAPMLDNTPYEGHFWVLTDEKNASATASFIQFCKENQFATLVGEPDNGDNCNGDPFLFSLPHSGLIVRFDLFYGLNIDGTCNGVSGCKPDIECESEEALDVCLDQINLRNE